MGDKRDPKDVHGGHRQRLKDLALTTDLQGLSSFQVLEWLLFYTIPYRDTNGLAHQLIDHFGSLDAVFHADYHSLLQVDGVGPNTASLLTMMPALFRRYRQESLADKCYILSQEQACDYITNFFIGKEYEEFYMICLNSQYRVIQAALLAQGSLSEVAVYPRIAVELALRHKAKYVILAHNHPGGSIRPSADDIRLTEKITELLSGISISVLDHFIFSQDKYFSFCEKGIMTKKY